MNSREDPSKGRRGRTIGSDSHATEGLSEKQDYLDDIRKDASESPEQHIGKVYLTYNIDDVYVMIHWNQPEGHSGKVYIRNNLDEVYATTFTTSPGF